MAHLRSSYFEGGSHVWPYFSLTVFHKNGEFLCSLERKKPELSKTHPTFVFRPLLVPFMAYWTRITVFFGTPCTKQLQIDSFLSRDIDFYDVIRTWIMSSNKKTENCFLRHFLYQIRYFPLSSKLQNLLDILFKKSSSFYRYLFHSS